MKNFTYTYNRQSQTLQQLDSCGKLVNSMHVPLEDLQKISFLLWVELDEN